MELKRLKETLEIRNKRITQLEAQVTHASGLISSRDPSTSTDISEDKLTAVVLKIENLAVAVEKLHSLSSSPSNHIVVNSCHTSPITPTAQVSTQTSNNTEETPRPTLHPGSGSPVSASRENHTVSSQAPPLASPASSSL